MSVSVVSHGHAAMLPPLLAALLACPEVGRVVLTRNIPEPAVELPASDRLLFIDNAMPQGFGANHNSAFARCADTPYFAVINPDIGLPADVFPPLIRCLETTAAAVVAPRVLSPAGTVEDSARRFPTAFGLASKALGLDDGRVIPDPARSHITVPWVAGMFMLLRSDDFSAVGGFDTGYFMYYEDVDLCVRLWRRGREVRLVAGVDITHDARRASHGNLRHMAWHAMSMSRYFFKHLGRLPRVAC